MLQQATCNFPIRFVKKTSTNTVNFQFPIEKLLEPLKLQIFTTRKLENSDLLKWQFCLFSSAQYIFCIMESNSLTIRDECVSTRAISLFTIAPSELNISLQWKWKSMNHSEIKKFASEIALFWNSNQVHCLRTCCWLLFRQKNAILKWTRSNFTVNTCYEPLCNNFNATCIIKPFIKFKFYRRTFQIPFKLLSLHIEH